MPSGQSKGKVDRESVMLMTRGEFEWARGRGAVVLTRGLGASSRRWVSLFQADLAAVHIGSKVVVCDARGASDEQLVERARGALGA